MYIVVFVFVLPDCSTGLHILMGLGCSLLFSKLTLAIKAVNKLNVCNTVYRCLVKFVKKKTGRNVTLMMVHL